MVCLRDSANLFKTVRVPACLRAWARLASTGNRLGMRRAALQGGYSQGKVSPRRVPAIRFVRDSGRGAALGLFWLPIPKKNKEHIKHSKYGSWHGIRRINNKHPGFKTGVERWMSEVRLWNLTDELRLRSSFFNLLLILNLAMCCLLKLSSGYGRRLMWNCASFKTPNVTT